VGVRRFNFVMMMVVGGDVVLRGCSDVVLRGCSDKGCCDVEELKWRWLDLVTLRFGVAVCDGIFIGYLIL
jgi:hypothetical protein